MIIAFMGIDGSGKTATAQATKKWLEEHTDKRVIYWTEFEYVFLNVLVRLLPQQQMGQTRQNYFDTTKKRSWLYRLWPYAVWLDSALAFLWHRWLSLTGQIIICDRYFYDYVIAFEGLGDSSRLVRKLFLLFPAPDIGILMDTPHEIAYQRKKNTHRDPIEWFARWRECYLQLNCEINFTVIRSDQPFDQTLEQVIEKIKIGSKVLPHVR